jgi:hypothetical protein
MIGFYGKYCERCLRFSDAMIVLESMMTRRCHSINILMSSEADLAGEKSQLMSQTRSLDETLAYTSRPIGGSQLPA